MVLLIFLGAFSCNEEVSFKNDKNDLVNFRDGFLEFRDQTAYDQMVKQLKGKSTEELDAWEKSLGGFISMRSIHNRALHEDEIFFENGGNPKGHSVFVLQNQEALLFESDDDMRVNLPPHENTLPFLVNKFGVIKIGSSIYEYRSKSIKEIRDGDVNKIKLLESFTESNKENNISVINITQKNISNTSGRNLKTAFSGAANCEGYTTGGGQRVQGRILSTEYVMVDVFGQTPYPGYIVYKTVAGYGATNQERRLGRWGNKNTAQLRIVGNVEYVSPLGSGSIAVDLDSGGSQTSSIAADFFNSGWWNTGPTIISFYGSLTFYGRDGTTCSI